MFIDVNDFYLRSLWLKWKNVVLESMWIIFEKFYNRIEYGIFII